MRRYKIDFTISLVVLLAAFTATSAQAQGGPRTPQSQSDTLALTLEQSVARAIANGQEVGLARTQVQVAHEQIRLVRAEALPQLNGNVGYTRTFASPFSTGGFSLPDSLKFSPDSFASVADRLRYLEKHVPSAGLGGLGSLFGNLPFGQKNAYTATLSGSQSLFSGGKLGAGLRIAHELEENAKLGLDEKVAEVELNVRVAYYRAHLAEQLVTISREALDQATRFLSTAQLRLEAGEASELEVLRAEVSLANLRPQLIQATNAADVATLDLKRLVNIPLDRSVKLVTPLEIPTARLRADSARYDAGALANRGVIRAAERQVTIREQEVRVARADYFPSLKLNFAVGKLLYPTGPFSLNQPWRSDATAGLVMSVPLFSGNRTRANVQLARIAVEQDRLRLAQLREGVQLDYERARGERARALSSIDATQRTVQQAQRVYDLTVLRYEQGLASQLEVSDSRLALLQSRTNLAQAVADYHIADATVLRSIGGTTFGR